MRLRADITGTRWALSGQRDNAPGPQRETKETGENKLKLGRDIMRHEQQYAGTEQERDE